MPIALGPGATGDKLAAKQDAGTDVIYEVNGDLRTISGSSDAYGSLAQGALSSSAAALVGPAAGTDMLIASINFINTGASTRTVTVYKTKNSTTYDATTVWQTLVLGAGESAEWTQYGWVIYNSQGIAKKADASNPLRINNAAVAAVTGYASDTYLAGSALALPAGLIKVGTKLHWVFDVVKTAAGTAAPTVIIRFGTAGTTGDTARVTFTFAAQTAAIDRGIFEIWAVFRSVGSGTSAVIAAIATLEHQLATTGLNNTTQGMQTLAVTSGGFDSTPSGSIAGLSVNGGTSASWTTTVVHADADM